MTTTQPRVGVVRHLLFAAIPLVLAAIVACSSGDGGKDTATEDEDQAKATTTTEPEDLVMEASDFVRLDEMTPVKGYFIENRLGHLDEALAVANNPDGGTFPVGTIIQLVPMEAMVKRHEGFDPALNDWEFFFLDTTAEGTTILSRGGAEVINRFGLSCASCHQEAEPLFDFICEKDHGCAPLPIGDDIIDAVQAADPRPPQP